MGVAVSTIEVHGSRRWRDFDWQLTLYLLLLIGFGIVLGISAAWNEAGSAGGIPQPVKTVIWTLLGFSLMTVAASVDYHWLRTFAIPIYLFTLGLLVVNLVAGTAISGAQLSVTIAGLDFQFSEISKVLMVVVLAAFLAGRGQRIGRLSTILGAGLLVALPTALVLRQPDLGTALVFVAILGGMLFISGASIGWMALLLGVAVVMTPLALGRLADYQTARLLCFLDPAADPQGACYQLVQALNAVGSGGWLGQGLTAGDANQLGFLPVQTTDFIFTIVAEELGLAGSLILLALFGLLLWRITIIGWRAKDGLGRLVAMGLATMLLFQVVVNIGMVIGLLPVTGIPLPLITYGGSSTVSLLFGMGLVQSVRMRTRTETF
ncbi:MAG TPA: FtsW/RodA/SpoVE family cell cycle protein [Candidatus Limnocylindria bacterium]|jgi:rod shape determining protein RodA|nr:FtsW/RodA/SpoVE family cell cycle protein [Candidatus Limnocylindria bacterium]